MGGLNHAHDEIMEELTLPDTMVLIAFGTTIIVAAACLYKLLKNKCIKYIRKEIRREIISTTVVGDHQEVKIL